MITVKIDVTQIDKSKLFKGKPKPDGKCPMYLSMVLIETKPTQFGDWRDDNTHMVVQDSTKEERVAGKKGAILGNAQDRSLRRTNDKPPADPTPAADSADPEESDDVPF